MTKLKKLFKAYLIVSLYVLKQTPGYFLGVVVGSFLMLLLV